MLIELLKNIRLDPQTKLYSAIEAGFRYRFDESMLNNLRVYFDNDGGKLMSEWYAGLSISDKAKVTRSSAFS